MELNIITYIQPRTKDIMDYSFRTPMKLLSLNLSISDIDNYNL